MLPSSGYFRNFVCPIFVDGKCNRPHCHYRHNKEQQDNVTSVSLSSSNTQSTSTSTSTCSSTSSANNNKRTYKPTPIAELENVTSCPSIQSQGSNSGSKERPRHIPVPYTPYRPEPRHLTQLTNSVSRYRPSIPSLPPPAAPPAYSPTPSNTTKDESATKYLPGSTAPSAGPQLYSPSTSTSAPGRFSYKPTPLEKPETAFEPEDDEPEEPRVKKSKRYGEPNIADPLFTERNDRPLESVQPSKTDIDIKRSDKSSKPEVNRKIVTSPPTETGSHSSKSKSSDGRTISKDKNRSRSDKNDRKDGEKSSSRSSSRSRSESNREKTSSSHSRDKKRSEYDPKKSSKSSSRLESDKSREKNHRKEKTTNLEKKSSDKPKERLEAPVNLCDDMSYANDESIEEISDSDEELRNQECLKIFEEYIPTVKENSLEHNKEPDMDVENDDAFQSNKKRVAHLSNRTPNRPIVKALPDHKANAIQMLAERTAKVKEFHKTSIAFPPPKTFSNIGLNLPNSNKSKVRIAHVPNVSTILDSKKVLVKAAPENKPSTVAQTISKGQTRVAHMPNDNFADRPGVLEPKTSKIASNVRTSYLNKMIDECLKIYVTAEDAYERALQEELSTSKKCKTISIYKNSALLAVTRLRKEIAEAQGVRKTLRSNDSNAISHENILIGKLGNTVSWSIENKYKKDVENSPELRGSKFYENIYKWILTDEQLQENGFPRPHPSNDKGKAIIYKRNEKQRPAEGNIRWCCRCKKQYKVDKKGFAIVDEECIYHPNNKYRFRGEVKYQCCGQDSLSDGCLSASTHVYEFIDYDNLRGYVRTLPKDKSSSEGHGIYALDCEMCYTTHGLDLTRVTVVDSNCKVKYESLVKPFYPIIDYNTRFSGLTEAIMKDVKTTILDVQAQFLFMFSDKTILVGHSLESDFKALKLIHNTVVDTSVLFPHKMGPPYKRALRNLTSEYLKKIIQNSVDGHDSAEDATVCMELIKWKLKEELKLR